MMRWKQPDIELQDREGNPIYRSVFTKIVAKAKGELMKPNTNRHPVVRALVGAGKAIAVSTAVVTVSAGFVALVAVSIALGALLGVVYLIVLILIEIRDIALPVRSKKTNMEPAAGWSKGGEKKTSVVIHNHINVH